MRLVKNIGLRKLIERRNRREPIPLTLVDVADLVECSERHVRRYANGGAPRWARAEARLAAALGVTVRTLRRRCFGAEQENSKTNAAAHVRDRSEAEGA
jgi:transcriptional regulator with XRE-family HTH domain